MLKADAQDGGVSCTEQDFLQTVVDRFHASQGVPQSISTAAMLEAESDVIKFDRSIAVQKLGRAWAPCLTVPRRARSC